MVHLTALFWCHASANLQVFAQSDSASMRLGRSEDDMFSASANDGAP